MQKLEKEFTAVLEKSPASGTYVVMPGSAEFFGTGVSSRCAERSTATLQASFMALGDGRHKLPIRADLRKAIGKEAGETVLVRLEQRLPDR